MAPVSIFSPIYQTRRSTFVCWDHQSPHFKCNVKTETEQIEQTIGQDHAVQCESGEGRTTKHPTIT
ncbi:hypothetical protein RHMOL_Rhmol10G0017500 [Rhododendron molle]|uniref:Uncharacterized protein n=2 Tax=Rhododendron molle TaxID=49168 RepID=A0ACC0LYU9_RHOML|nr:hypothetical protein RHMOL_Rhmol10G0017500 [Rhododendron molle]KAI8533522.1 hypothetical protein RHMOL_Rhmol10G0017500 [Rhododendron molle]